MCDPLGFVPPPTSACCKLRFSSAKRIPSSKATSTSKLLHKPASASPSVPTTSNSTRPSNDTQRSLFIFGLGYVGYAIAQHAKQLGWKVEGTAQRDERFYLIARRLRVHDIDSRSPSATAELMLAISRATHILSTVPPVKAGDDYMSDVILDQFVEKIHDRAKPIWLGYLSSTSVYSESDSAIVTESSPTSPHDPLIRARLLAESRWTASSPPSPLHTVAILRLAGVYGPLRNALRTTLRASPTPQDAAEIITPRVLVEDVCRLSEAVMAAGLGGVFNVSDAGWASRGEVAGFASGLMGRSGVGARRGKGGGEGRRKSRRESARRSKRVDGSAVLRATGMELLHPTYREGLTAIFEGRRKLQPPLSIF